MLLRNISSFTYGQWRYMRALFSSQAPSRLLPSNVIVSTSNDIYSNLALEDWIYENFNTAAGSQELLMIWRNNPCVVVGRHQNVWVESGVLSTRHEKHSFEKSNSSTSSSNSCVKESEVIVARRRSGGGAVFHDKGNVNLTCFTNRKRYDRKRNLMLVSETMNSRWNLDLSVNSRDDIIMDNKYKVSGTASKLGGKVAYHHFTLLLNADLPNVDKYLRGFELGISSKATPSVRSSVRNICSDNSSKHITFDDVRLVVGEAFCRSIEQQVSWCSVNPMDESLFPGVTALRSELEKWDWIFGNSPKFTIARSFLYDVNGSSSVVSITLTIEKGHIKESKITVSDSTDSAHSDWLTLCKSVSDSLIGVRFWTNDVVTVCKACCNTLAREADSNIVDFIVECIRKLTSGC